MMQRVRKLGTDGADQVLPEKLKIAIDLFQRVSLKKLFPQKQSVAGFDFRVTGLTTSFLFS